MVGVVDAVIPPLTADFVTNEYTFVITGAVQQGAAVVTGGGTDLRGTYTSYQISYANGARFEIYEDPAKNNTPASGTRFAETLRLDHRVLRAEAGHRQLGMRPVS